MKNRLLFSLTLLGAFIPANLQSMDNSTNNGLNTESFPIMRIAKPTPMASCITVADQASVLKKAIEADNSVHMLGNPMRSGGCSSVAQMRDKDNAERAAKHTPLPLRPLKQKQDALDRATSTSAHPAVASQVQATASQFHNVADSKARSEFECKALEIDGARSEEIDLVFADEVLKNCPEAVADIVINIQKNIFRAGEKDVVLYGVPGTGKSTIPLAIAKKCNIPCLFFGADSVSTKWQNEGIMNLGKIFNLALAYNKPCMIVMDELESLTEKHVSKDNNEKGILRAFWGEMDKIKNSKIILVANMNSRKDLPENILGRAAQIEVPLPTLEQREKAFTVHLNKQSQQYKVEYDSDVTTKNLAEITHEFSHRDIRNLVTRATRKAIISDDNKLVTMQDCTLALASVVNDPKRQTERAKGTWYYETKKFVLKHKLPIGIFVAGAVIGAYYYFDQKSINAKAKITADIRYEAQQVQIQQQQADTKAQNEINNKNTAESLIYQRTGTCTAVGGAAGTLIGGAIGGLQGGKEGAELGAKVGAIVGSSLGTLAGGGAQFIWDGSKWVVSAACEKASESCSIQ